MSRPSNPEGDDEKKEEAKGKERAWRGCGLFLISEVSDPIEPIKPI
jgi:hypothetical protein